MKAKQTISKIIIHILLLLTAAVTLYPLFVMIVSSLKTNLQFFENIFCFVFPLHWEHYSIAWPQIYPYMLNSFIVTGGTIVITMVASSLAGFAFARYKFFGKNILFYLMMMMMMVPYFLILIPQFIMCRDLGMLNTYIVQILPSSGAFSILSTFLIRTHMEGLSESLFEAASLEGAGDFRIFSSIAIPLSKPILATVFITTLISSWNNYIWPLVAANTDEVSPIVVAITTLTADITQRQGVQFSGYILASLPLVLVFIFATKPFVEGLTAGSIKA